MGHSYIFLALVRSLSSWIFSQSSWNIRPSICLEHSSLYSFALPRHPNDSPTDAPQNCFSGHLRAASTYGTHAQSRGSLKVISHLTSLSQPATSSHSPEALTCPPRLLPFHSHKGFPAEQRCWDTPLLILQAAPLCFSQKLMR